MKYYLYKTINTINGKVYVGIHQSNCIERDTYLGSGKALKKAIKKYGVSNFYRVILEEFNTKIEALNSESNIVNDKFLRENNTYNIIRGGGGPFNPEQIQKTVLSLKEVWRDPDKRKQRVERAKQQWKDPSRKEKASLKLRGRCFSDTHKNNISNSLKVYNQLHQKERKSFHSSGGKTSKGTKFITSSDNLQTIRVNNEKIPDYLLKGWRLGTTRKNNRAEQFFTAS